jgi:hypothetical protein
MGFLNWWKNNADESDSQLDLFGGSQKLSKHQRVDVATVHQDFTKAIKDSGGSRKAYPRAIQAETQELFDCDVDELYLQTGGKKGERSTLPKEAQKAYMVNETISAHRLDSEVKEHNSDTQQQKDDRIVETVRDSAENVRKWMPW